MNREMSKFVACCGLNAKFCCNEDCVERLVELCIEFTGDLVEVGLRVYGDESRWWTTESIGVRARWQSR